MDAHTVLELLEEDDDDEEEEDEVEERVGGWVVSLLIANLQTSS